MSQDNFVNQILFDKYKITKRLNNGSFGVVYQGINLRTKDPLAIKFVIKIEFKSFIQSFRSPNKIITISSKQKHTV